MTLRVTTVCTVALVTMMTMVMKAEAQTPTQSNADANRLFTLKVLPLLKEKCFGCHGTDPNDIRGDYDLLTREGMIKGGESEEPSLVPGKPAESPLYQAVLWEGMEMPPKETDRLSEQETRYLHDWIAAGAPWPTKGEQKKIQQELWSVRENEDGILVDTSGGLADDWTYRRYQAEDVWAFRPVEAPVISGELEPGQNPIDALIEERLDKAGLTASDQADARTLLRRLSFDLLGLPPDAKQFEEFERAWQIDPSKAWAAAIDEMLASKHFGERQAQHWLDVVRYADTAGFSNDYERSNAWRYRDYVIRSFNEDKPFNEFVVEQIAGDELNPQDPESLVATGMLRMGPWGTAMIPKEEARQIYLDDLVHNVGQSFLAMPMRCCKCHDHKFDPIPTRDYYRMYAAFASTQPAEMKAEFLPGENLSGFEQKRELVEELLEFAKSELNQVNQKQENAAKQWYAEHGLPYKDENARKNDPEDQKPPRHVGLTPEEKGIKKVREQDVWIWERRLERYEPMAQSVYNGKPGYVNGRKLRRPGKLDPKWRPETRILAGGALEAPADAVQPGVLSATGLAVDEKAEDPWLITDELDGRRLALAIWIADDRNPLTARVIVNRVWQSHFGQGLVKTANNFGAKGGKPTHPELLDWLTTDFVRHGWKLKRLHRMIVSSQVYQRSGKPIDSKQMALKDPNNELLSVFPPRRLSAEELRDSILQVTGELNPEMGGVPIMPEINMEVALQPRMIQFSIAPAHQPSRTPSERNRRTIYAYRVRGQADPFLEIMNLPNPNESCELRNSAAVTPQAFTLLNSDVMTDRSIAFAIRIQKEKGQSQQAWIRHAMELAYGRIPSDQEQRTLGRYLEEMVAYHEEHPPEATEYPTQVTRSLVEEFTGEPFEFTEKLNVYEDYEPDAKPWTVDANTRALADVCLLLFNANEFLYVY